MMNNNIGICIPTFNESRNIIKLVDNLIKIKNVIICIVDDNSPDKTYELLVKKYFKDLNKKIFVIKRKKKNGRGSAVWTGFKKLKILKVSTYVEMDSDFSHSIFDLKKGLNIFSKRQKKIDVLLGSRYPNGRIINWPIQRRIFSKLANLLARFLISNKIYDYTNGFRFYNTKAMKIMLSKKPKNKGYVYLIETLSIFIDKKLRIIEYDIVFKNRIRGKSNTTFREIFNSLKGIFAIAFNFYFKKY